MHTLRGLLFVKHASVGSRSEGPVYFLQTEHKDVTLRRGKRLPWELDYLLEFHNRHIVEVSGEDAEGGAFEVSGIRRLAAARIPDADPYLPTAGLLVLSTDVVGGFVAPNVLVNHVMQTRIYGDGKVVFLQPSTGYTEIFEGRLTVEQITDLFYLLEDHGFWGFAPSYTVQGPADMPTTFVTAHRRGEEEKRVSCYAAELSAPPGFLSCHEALLATRLRPSNVQSYVRQPITKAELAQGWYYGFEYQKKLDTPVDWTWMDAGRSSMWQKPKAA